MKKRYVAGPVIMLGVALAWNFAWRTSTPVATAEEIQPYVAPKSDDPRHPIDVYMVGITEGESKLDVISHLPEPVYPEDKVSFIVDPSWGLGGIVHVQRALPVTINYGRRHFEVKTWANTVEEVLAEKDLELGDLDKSNYKNADALKIGMAINITPVSKVNVTHKEVIKYEMIDKDDPNMYRRETKVAEEGENGERSKEYEITREDGIEVSRKLIKDEVTKKPKSKVVLHGTKIKIGKTASGKATYYDLCCKKVASNQFKKGTVLRLTNRNNGKQIEVTVDDTGAFGSEIVVDLHPSYFQQLGGTLGQGVMQNILAEEILNP